MEANLKIKRQLVKEFAMVEKDYNDFYIILFNNEIIYIYQVHSITN